MRVGKLLTLKCREAAELMSRSMDGDLTSVDRWALRLHMMVCAACRTYRRQVESVRRALKEAAGRLENDGPLPGPAALPDELRERLRAIADADQA